MPFVGSNPAVSQTLTLALILQLLEHVFSLSVGEKGVGTATLKSESTRRAVLAQFLAYGPIATGWPALANAAVAAAKSWNFGSSTIEWQPLKIARGDTLLVAAQFAGSPVQAVLDSGSGASIISVTLAAKLGFNKGEERTISGLSGKAPVMLVRDVEVVFGRQTRRLAFAVVGDLGALSAAFGEPIDLLLGADVFAGSCVALDFARRRLAITKSGAFIPGPEWSALKLGHGAKKELFVLASVAGGSPVPLMLDLGSSAALMLSSAYIDAHGLTKGEPTSTAALGGVEGVTIIDVFTTPNVAFGGLNVAGVPTLGMRSWLSTSTVGNIGLPLVAQFDAVFDVTAGFVWLRPLEARQRLPILKDRSGLGVAASAAALTVVHVAANSPAEKAGWAAGDRIAAVNGRAIDATYARGERWRWRFAPPGTIVKLTDQLGRERELKLADYY